MGCAGELPTSAVVSVWPKPSRSMSPHAFFTRPIISGFNGSPAPTTSLKLTSYAERSSWISMRQTVGGAQSVVIRYVTSASSVALALNRAVLWTNTVAPAFHGANTQLHACLAQPGELMFRCTSPGLRPIQYIVDKWPTG